MEKIIRLEPQGEHVGQLPVIQVLADAEGNTVFVFNPETAMQLALAPLPAPYVLALSYALGAMFEALRRAKDGNVGESTRSCESAPGQAVPPV